MPAELKRKITQSVKGAEWWLPVNGSYWRHPEGFCSTTLTHLFLFYSLICFFFYFFTSLLLCILINSTTFPSTSTSTSTSTILSFTSTSTSTLLSFTSTFALPRGQLYLQLLQSLKDFLTQSYTSLIEFICNNNH